MKKAFGLLALIVVGGLGVVGWYYTLRNVPVTYSDPVERFKYGSIGSEAKNGIPKYVFLALPDVCPDKLPGGYASFGMLFEPGHNTPIGLSERTIGIPRLGVNCAFCHTETVRTAADAKPQLVAGGPPQTFDMQSYLRFITACVLDPRFTADNVLGALDKQGVALSPVERLLYRYAVVPKVKALIGSDLVPLTAFYNGRPQFGPGRYDAINSVKVLLDLTAEHPNGISVVDYMSIWRQREHEHHRGNWGGDHSSLKERNRVAAMAAAASADVLDDAAITLQEEWFLDLEPPKYPFPVDAELAKRGVPVFEQHCARCHAPGSPGAGTVIPLDELKTDGERIHNFSDEIANRLNKVATDSFQIHAVRNSNGYIAPLLEGIWLRAPYLHGGAVPNLRELLAPPEKRSPSFYRGYDVYDPVNVGFVSQGAEAEKVGFKFDTSLPGNGNGGHLYGTELSDDDKNALIEFLKSYELPKHSAS